MVDMARLSKEWPKTVQKEGNGQRESQKDSDLHEATRLAKHKRGIKE